MIKLIHGDCLIEMGKIEEESIDLIINDPPYGTTSIEWDNILNFDEVWEHYDRIMKPNGIVVMFGSQPFTSKLILSNEKWFKYELIWNKNKCGSPGLAKIRPMKVHENIIIFAKNTKTTYNPQMEKGEPYYRTSKDEDGYTSKRNTHSYGLKPVSKIVNHGTRYPKSIINISRDFSAQQQIHPTQKPVPLMDWLVKTYSNKGDLVLDNTMGSCPVGISCQKLYRDFIGIEQDKEYFNIAEKRIYDERQNKLFM